MATAEQSYLRSELQRRRDRLESVLSVSGKEASLARLLGEVDAALARMDQGGYGLCEVCHDPIEADRILADPLVRFCLDHLTTQEQRALEDDLQLVGRIQRGLLPPSELRTPSWEARFHYEPASLVSGDYCDLIQADGTLYFLLGDVAGKGVAASLLMSHLHATFRSLISVGLPLEQMVEAANRVFCESTFAGQYATAARIPPETSNSSAPAICPCSICATAMSRRSSPPAFPSACLRAAAFLLGAPHSLPEKACSFSRMG